MPSEFDEYTVDAKLHELMGPDNQNKDTIVIVYDVPDTTVRGTG